jgi:nitrogen-specific signal transduction histidine kinase
MRTLSLVLVLGAIGGGAAQVATSYYYWQHRHVRGLIALVPTALTSGIAAFSYGVALAVPDAGLTRLLYGIYFCGVVVSTVGWFLFVLMWTERLPRIRSRWIPILGVPYGLIMTATVYEVFLLGADRSSAIMATIEITATMGLTVPQFVPGWFGLVYSLLSFLLYLATIGLLLSFIRRPSQRLYRQQNQLLFFAMSVPAVAEIALRALSLPFEGMPVTTLPATLAVATAIFRYGVFNVSPIARRGLVEELDAGILAFDEEGRIIDANQLARSLLDASGQLVGKTVETVLEGSSLDIETGGEESLQESVDGQVFAVDRNDETRYYTAQRSTIQDDDESIAKALLFSDMTAQMVRERELDMLKQVFSRVLRHNLRNDMNVIEGAASELARTNDGRDAELAQQIQTKSNFLFDISEKARLVEQVVESSSRRTPVHLVSVVETVLQRMETSYPAATFETDLPESLTVLAHPALEIAIENAVENAVEHCSSRNPAGTARAPTGDRTAERLPVGVSPESESGAHSAQGATAQSDEDTVTVSVTLSTEGDRCTLDISDDGPGIPEAELAPLEEQSETQLEHTSGVGLWLIQWVVDSSEGDVTFQSSSHGTTVSLDLEVVGASPSESESESMGSLTPHPDIA